MSGGFIGQCGINAPDAPTIGTATAPSGTSISVPFTAPTCVGGSAVTGYVATARDACGNTFANTGASSPITISCVTAGTAYTAQVLAKNAYGASRYSAASNSVSPPVLGQQAYTTVGSYCWTAPTGATSVSVVAVGGGGSGGYYASGGGGAGLGYKNNYSVTPGSCYSVVVGAGGSSASCGVGADSYFVSTATVKGGGGGAGGTCYSGPQCGGAGGTYTGDGGGAGGAGGNSASGGPPYRGSAGAGGAGGYSGAGGAGGNESYSSSNTGCNGSGGSGGGGASGYNSTACTPKSGGGGGGVGILGEGASGYGGMGGTNGYTNPTYKTDIAGKGGSGGADSVTRCITAAGGAYGGGSIGYNIESEANGGGGAVRIIWPGNTRSFPSTCTGDL